VVDAARIEDIEVPARDLADADLEGCRFVAERIAQGALSGLSDQARLFFADLAQQLAGLAEWRAQMVDKLDRSLSDEPDDGAARGFQMPAPDCQFCAGEPFPPGPGCER
jgi:hypothetical protein